MDLYFLNYNNYYNRIIKKENSLADYLTYVLVPKPNTAPTVNNLPNTNFIPGDEIYTKHVVNWENESVPNYVLAVENGDIKSRWFMISHKRNVKGQYEFTLKRDLLADRYEPIINAPCFIEKATLDSSDPMIFNAENMDFNQIKKSETLLKDETNCPWIVAYMATNDSEGTVQEYSAQADYGGITYHDITVNGINNWEYAQYINNTYRGNVEQIKYNTHVTETSSQYYSNESFFTYIFNRNSEDSLAYNEYESYLEQHKSSLAFRSGLPVSGHTGKINYAKNAYFQFISTYLTTLNSQAEDYIDNIGSFELINNIRNLNGKIIEDTSVIPKKYYKINIINNTLSSNIEITSGTLFDNLINILTNTEYNGYKVFQKLPSSNNMFSLDYKINTSMIQLEEVGEYTATVNITNTRYHLEDAPYDLICMPYSDDLVIKNAGVELFNSSKELAFNIMMALARKYGGSSAQFLYDIQLLPYCPVRYLIKENGDFDINNNTASFNYITTGGENPTNIGAVFYARSSSFTFNIEHQIDIENVKVDSQCDIYRLCSPNYSGVFEFNPAKNNGVTFFNVDCTYKPFTPYIHLNPNFGLLYGDDFNDSRGLICGGDFSLPIVTSSWESYQLSNKNYQQIFDRQITNMERNNSIQEMKDITSAVAGTLSGTISGATSGALAGGGLGALFGGIPSGLASLFGGLLDIEANKYLRQEAIDYTKDNFGYQLGNIKALPSSISKTTAFTFNNKIFPFIEYYSCTDEEKNALKDKLKYNGMTVMRIGTISEFIRPELSYIKGKLIRLENADVDFDMLQEIANEIYKGVFI